MPNIGFPELILICVALFLVFGAKRLPELGKGVGEAITNFKKSMKSDDPPAPKPQS